MLQQILLNQATWLLGSWLAFEGYMFPAIHEIKLRIINVPCFKYAELAFIFSMQHAC